MRPTRIAPEAALQYRRIGRKALFADRLNRAVGPAQKKTSFFPWQLPNISVKAMVLTAFAVVTLSGLGFGGSQFYFAQAAANEKAAALKEQKIAKEKSAAADACRRKKVEEKADQIGKLTYDQLYDNDSCDR
jgi:hypothetical protein